MRSEGRQLSGVTSPLERDDQLLNGLDEGLRRLQLVDDGLHVGLVVGVAYKNLIRLIK